MISYNRWFKILLSGGLILMAFALVVSLLLPFLFSIAGPWGPDLANMSGSGMMGGGMMGPEMMNRMMDSGMMSGMMDGGGFSSPFAWLVALPRLLFALGILLGAGAGVIWLAQVPLMQDRSALPPHPTQGES